MSINLGQSPNDLFTNPKAEQLILKISEPSDQDLTNQINSVKIRFSRNVRGCLRGSSEISLHFVCFIRGGGGGGGVLQKSLGICVYFFQCRSDYIKTQAIFFKIKIRV